MTSDLDMLRRVTEWLSQAAVFVDHSTLTWDTPCADWNVEALLDHVTGGNRFTVNILSGLSADDALAAVHASFASEAQTGVDQPQVAAVDSARTQLQAFQANGALSGTYDHVVGTLTGEQILRLRIHDMAIHIWDLLQAVNPKKGLDPVYVRWAIQELAKPDSLTAQHIATGYDKPSKSYELLLAFGRRRRETGSHLRHDR